jgi:murein DD-endopeptidase MepM/ murein hydrolase activator NlpD
MAFHKPTNSNKVTCAYHTKGSVWQAGHHTGTDYAGDYGDPVYAVAGGTVIHANRMGGWGLAYGIHVIIESEGVVEGKLQTLYAHLAYVNLEVIGKGKVKAGDIIGYVGSTGTRSSGPHLHLEMRVAPFLYDNKTLNPESVIKLSTVPVKKPPVKKVGSVKK